ncbi:MAG: branched-chain amino acid ABC transporter permease [Actinomycetota bacterium]|nr:branched-chain amino acid ABC transporter permease [Actinomycetota bacterium]
MSTIQTLLNAVGLGATYGLMAVGIGLVFGVLRLVNFAYGQLVMAGAYALVLTSERGWPGWASVLTCLAVVLALSLLMELVVFRPLRDASAATMLVATFAVAFLLQAIALLKFGSLGRISTVLASLFEPVSGGELQVRWITIVAIAVAAVALVGLVLLLGRTTIGLHMRAAAADFHTARLLGVKADRVITAAVLISGVLAAAVAVILTVQTPLVTPDFALRDTIIVLVGVVVGGLERLWTATLGGFAIGFATSLLGELLPSASTVYLDSAIFALVIVVLLLRPAGLFAPLRARPAERV